ncbi:hypothetical protein DACRYDRAFT_96965 [Dacryopinax primogenitus]|uniref:Nudix hydrolase domain-containing protein n=1 Tax=Dacryopinax primogenitus (strain DJM 731) TaxID=1858805 RepID=M5FQX8_DACPD|nr:uncharacterized protein DACRYDRAFT_96965 [Dacryopinax primogenitus]EJT98008.1 hypothetical protein DACRYDRAFT_96965 [Dacryopinax primogenitus]
MATTSDSPETIRLLAHALKNIRATPPRIISSPATQPARASVAIIVRVRPPPSAFIAPPAQPVTLQNFFSQPWVNHPQSRAEVLFLPRTDTLAFPGGKQHTEDEGSLYTAMRECWEQVGIDLADSKEYECVGQMDDREVTSKLGKRLLMVLTPFVFLCLTPDGGQVDFGEDVEPDSRAFWIPLCLLATLTPTMGTISLDVASRMAPQSRMIRLALRTILLGGQMHFGAIVVSSQQVTIVLPSAGEKGKCRELEPTQQHGLHIEELRVWGMSLGMTLDLVAQMRAGTTDLSFPRPLSMSLTSIFPRFDMPDVNFWLWAFGKRYRKVIRGWKESYRTMGAHDRRINWSGSALANFYASVRKALIMTIVFRVFWVLVAFIVWIRW